MKEKNMLPLVSAPMIQERRTRGVRPVGGRHTKRLMMQQNQGHRWTHLEKLTTISSSSACSCSDILVKCINFALLLSITCPQQVNHLLLSRSLSLSLFLSVNLTLLPRLRRTLVRLISHPAKTVLAIIRVLCSNNRLSRLDVVMQQHMILADN